MTGDHHPADDLRPWEPVRFAVGQRVRVRMSPECFCWDLRREGRRRPSENGHIGVITSVQFDGMGETREAKWADHRLWVELEPPFPKGIEALALSAAELEPLDKGANE